jgi:hypothetical protein
LKRITTGYTARFNASTSTNQVTLVFCCCSLLIDLSRRRFLSRNTSLWCAEESRRRQFASSSGDKGLRGLGDMVLDSEIDWEQMLAHLLL